MFDKYLEQIDQELLPLSQKIAQKCKELGFKLSGKLGRNPGKYFVEVKVENHSRMPFYQYSTCDKDEVKPTAISLLITALVTVLAQKYGAKFATGTTRVKDCICTYWTIGDYVVELDFYIQNEYMEIGVKHGLEVFLLKEIELEQLAQTIEELLLLIFEANKDKEG